MAKFDIYEAVTERIIQQLQQGVIPWQKPWTGTQHGAISGTTGKPYSLLNQMLLGNPGEYYTYSQVLSHGGAVRKGEKSQIVVFWKQVKVSDMQDDETQSPVDRLIPMLRYYNVFHIDQCDGLTPRFNQPAEPTPIPAADEIIDHYSQREHNRHRFRQFLRHRVSCPQRNPEVHVERIHYPIEILHRQRLVQAQHDACFVDLLLSDDGGIALHIRCGRINGRETHQQKRKKRDHKQGQQDDNSPPNEIASGPLCHKITSKS